MDKTQAQAPPTQATQAPPTQTTQTPTAQEQIQSHNQAIEQNQKWLSAKEKEVKTAQSVIKKYKAQIKTITLEKELLLRTNNLCFSCHKQLSSDEVKFCIDKGFKPLCQTCQRKPQRE